MTFLAENIYYVKIKYATTYHATICDLLPACCILVSPTT